MCEHGGTDHRNLLDTLRAALETLRTARTVTLSSAVADTELTQAVQLLEAAARVCEGQKLRLIGELDQRQAHRGQGARTTEDLLASALHLSRGQAKQKVELAAGLALVPDTAAALADGRLGVDQARVTVRKAEEVKGRDDARELLSAIDQAAASVGQTVDRQRLARTLDEVVHAQAPDVLGDRVRLAQRRRGVWFTERDGVPAMEARLPVDGMAAVRAALDALGKPDGAKDPRTVAQRHCDALVALAVRFLDEGELPDVAAQRPHVLLITSRYAGRRRNRPAALQGTRPRLGLGHPEFALGGPGRRPRPPQAPARARKAGIDVSGVRRGNRPRVLAMRQQAARTAAGRPSVRTRWLGRSRRPVSRDGTPRGWNCHTHIHHHGWQVTRDASGRYRAGPPDLVPPHLENSIAIHTHAHTG